MNQNYTDITIVLDRSGSMSQVASDTIGGFNRFLSDQKKAPGKATITLNQFDHEFERVLDNQDIQNAKELTEGSFVPRGNTALLDAIGRSIVETGQRLDKLPEQDKPGKVIFVIITDGQENASREYDKEKVNQMVTDQKNQWSWEFVFLGANQDAIKTGVSFGINQANSMTYAHNSKGTKAAFAATSDNLVAMRSGRSKSMAYSDADRDLQKKAGA